MKQIVLALIVVAGLTTTGCSLGLRLDHAPAGSAIGADVQGPGETVVLRDAQGRTLAGASFTFNPMALLENLVALVQTQLGWVTRPGVFETPPTP